MILFSNQKLQIGVKEGILDSLYLHMGKYAYFYLIFFLSTVSIFCFLFFLSNGLGLAYNDARSHLDIGRRVVEGLKPGLAQLGSVWLPLPHILMIPTIWNDFMWHSGLSGALESMVSFVITGLLIYAFLQRLGIGPLGRLMGVLVFALNINVMYLQSTAMTELMLIATMTWGIYELLVWFQTKKLLNLIYASFFIMLSTLNRYDGWFLLIMSALLVGIYTLKKSGYIKAEGVTLFFLAVGALGIALWFLWNLVIFKDPLYFILGPYSAHTQQEQLAQAGVLSTKRDLLLSTKIYLYALAYNSNTFILLLGVIGALFFWFDKKIKANAKVASLVLFSPMIFNILALYLGFSVIFVQGLSGTTWFNVRYGVLMMPTIAIFVGYLTDRLKSIKYSIIGLIFFVLFFSIANTDAVTIDDARVGASQKNVSEVSSWLLAHAANQKGFILISAASHDAIIFSSGLPMKRFIHEGTGKYWESATTSPDRWARWIIMRTYDNNDSTYKLVSKTQGLKDYALVGKYPFADIYELKSQFLKNLNTEAIITQQK